jgi:hypothetical protein
MFLMELFKSSGAGKVGKKGHRFADSASESRFLQKLHVFI